MDETERETPWLLIERLRKTNRAIYESIEALLGKSSAQDPTVDLMKRFYVEYPILGRVVHREILRNDQLIHDHSAEMAYDTWELSCS